MAFIRIATGARPGKRGPVCLQTGTDFLEGDDSPVPGPEFKFTPTMAMYKFPNGEPLILAAEDRIEVRLERLNAAPRKNEFLRTREISMEFYWK